MSRDKGKTTAKKSYSEAATPKKKKTKERNNPFFSLSEQHISLLPSGRKMPKKPPTNVSPTGSIIGTQPEPSLQEKLEELIQSVAAAPKNNPHEIMKGLNASGITTWSDFVRMDEDDIPLLLYYSNGSTIPISAQSQRIINHIKQLVWKNIREKVPNARLASTYILDMLDDYIDDIRDNKRTNTAYNTLT